MDDEDILYLLRNGELPPAKEIKPEAVELDTPPDEYYYLTTEFSTSSSPEIWKDKYAIFPFIISVLITVIITIIDLSDSTKFDLTLIILALIFWFVTFVALLILTYIFHLIIYIIKRLFRLQK